MLDAPQITPAALASMDEAALRVLTGKLLERIQRDGREIAWRTAKIDQLTFEMAQLKRVRFGKKSELLDADQRALFDEAVDADIAALQAQLDELAGAAAAKAADAAPAADADRRQPKRTALPAHLPRVERHHEPERTACACGCEMRRIGQDVSEKLDYTPGVFTVERHIRGKWACAACHTLVQAPVPAAVIDKGIPTAGLLAQVLVAKHADHLPLYRQEPIFGRAGLAIPRSTLAAWVGACGARLQPIADALKAELLGCSVLHADETPVAMLAPGSGKTHRAYLWAYASGEHEAIKAVVYDFAESRSGEHARAFLGWVDHKNADNTNADANPAQGQREGDHGKGWRGSLVCDDFSAYKALFARGVIEAGCMAHARRRFVELQTANQSTVAVGALELIRQLYGIEREVRNSTPEQRLQARQTRSAPIARALHDWLLAQRSKVADGAATAKAIDYSLKRWTALVRFLLDPALPIDNNHDERQIRPWTTGRKNWLFVGTLMAGKRAAAITSLIQSAKLNGHDPYAYLKDVLTRLPTQRDRDISELLPHRWEPMG